MSTAYWLGFQRDAKRKQSHDDLLRFALRRHQEKHGIPADLVVVNGQDFPHYSPVPGVVIKVGVCGPHDVEYVPKDVLYLGSTEGWR